MDTTLKQRILGVVVLVALLGFCLTVLLRNTKETTPHTSKINIHPALWQSPLAVAEKSAAVKPVNIPPTPVPASALPLPQPASAVVAPLVSTTTEVAPEPDILPSEVLPSVPPQQPEVLPQTKISSPPAVKSSHKTVSVAVTENKKISTSTLRIQVGTFSVAGNAKTLAEKLRKRGFVANTQKVKTAKGEMTRVIVGKKGLSHAQAEALRQKLHKVMNLPGIIVSS